MGGAFIRNLAIQIHSFRKKGGVYLTNQHSYGVCN